MASDSPQLKTRIFVPLAFPETESGVELRILKQLFTPDEEWGGQVEWSSENGHFNKQP